MTNTIVLEIPVGGTVILVTRFIEWHKKADQIPDGWTNDPADLEGWFTPCSEEAYQARCHGIENGNILMRRKNESGEMEYIFTAEGRYYWGHLIIDHIFEITRPKTLPGILHVLDHEGSKALGRKRVKWVQWVELPEEDGELTVDRSNYVPVGPDTPAELGNEK